MTLGAIPEAKVPREDELEREEKFLIGRRILVAVDHGRNSQRAFTWALDQFVTHVDKIHLLHVLPKGSGSETSPIYEATQMLYDKLSKEALDKCSVKIVKVFRSGDVGKEICAEATRVDATAVVMGCRGLGVVKSLLVGSATDYCVRHSPVPVIVVPQCAEPSTPTEETSKESIWKLPVDGS
ncbi:unnamed protein product [Calypogeia fissa]